MFSKYFKDVASGKVQRASEKPDPAGDGAVEDDSKKKGSGTKKQKKNKPVAGAADVWANQTKKSHGKGSEGTTTGSSRGDKTKGNTHSTPSNNNRSNNGRSSVDGQKQGRKRRRNNEEPHEGSRLPRRKPPSPEALELSQRLMDLSKRKKLDQALEMYWDKEHDKIRDAHHACIVVDCCARCGDISQAKAVLEAITPENTTIELQTALIKGYAHSGDMHSAMQVFRSLFSTDNGNGKGRARSTPPPPNKRPNVRTLNTVLRGCLWTAATTRQDKDGHGKDEVAGGVVSSEEAWQLYLKHCGEHSPPDSSSYEHSIALLCQSLNMDEAQKRIAQFQEKNNIRIKGKAGLRTEKPEQSTLETFGAVYLSLARAFALLGNYNEMWTAGQRCLQGIQASKALVQETGTPADDPKTAESSQTKKRRKKEATMGGKRARKKYSDDTDQYQRIASNMAYRLHRLNEMETEVKSLLKLRKSREAESDTYLEALYSHLCSRLFCFGGGGSTELTPSQERNNKPKTSEKHGGSDMPVWQSFGVSEPTESMLQNHQDCFDSKGRLKTSKIFGKESSSCPLDVELGAGFGDWICRQAQQNLDRNYIGVELRTDRVHQIFAKTMLADAKPLTNVCVIGADAGHLLRSKIKKGSLSTLFVNHPEPPTQTFGDDRVELEQIESGEAEPAHMLSYATLKAAFGCLQPGGKIIVVTDNKWYARLLCATLVRLSPELKSMHMMDSSLLTRHGFQEVEKFKNGVRFFEGQPNEGIGHVHVEEQSSAQAGSSYFDRLWRTGASNHAQRTSRFVVAIRRNDV